jgi:hypothetical protein
MAHVSDHSIHHQLYTDFEIYRKMPLHWVAISILVGYHKFTQKKFSSSGIAILFHNCPLLFKVLRLKSPIPYTWKSLFMLGCLHCFHLQKVIKIHIFYAVGLSASCPTPNLEDQGIPFSLGHHLDLFGIGGSTTRYATARIALSIIWPRKHKFSTLTTALTGTCWRDWGSTFRYVGGLGCEMLLTYVSFMPIKVAEGWPTASFQHSSQLPTSPRACPLPICLLATEQTT